jgi:DNA adenine methylase
MIEPFAGGGIISLTAAFERLVDHVVICELDPEVVAVWKVIASPNWKELVDRILNFEVSEEHVREVLASEPDCDQGLAFRTIIKNRMLHGGILAPGASLMKSGENGKGLSSRWYAKTLATRIESISEIRQRLTVIHGDGIVLLKEHQKEKSTVSFIDPPYTAAGKKAGTRLYRYSALDHRKLFQVTSRLKGDFLMTYDNADGVRELASENEFDIEPIPMKSTHHAKMTELLIGRDLTWARAPMSTDSQMELRFD